MEAPILALNPNNPLSPSIATCKIKHQNHLQCHSTETSRISSAASNRRPDSPDLQTTPRQLAASSPPSLLVGVASSSNAAGFQPLQSYCSHSKPLPPTITRAHARFPLPHHIEQFLRLPLQSQSPVHGCHTSPPITQAA